MAQFVKKKFNKAMAGYPGDCDWWIQQDFVTVMDCVEA